MSRKCPSFFLHGCVRDVTFRRISSQIVAEVGTDCSAWSVTSGLWTVLLGFPCFIWEPRYTHNESGAKDRADQYPWKLRIADYSWIGEGVTLYTLGEITVGDHAVISQHSYLCTGSHDYTQTTFDLYAVPIHVESESWVAARVFVGPGVTIGRGTIVGAASVVLKDIPEGIICAGNPLRVIGPRPISSTQR